MKHLKPNTVITKKVAYSVIAFLIILYLLLISFSVPADDRTITWDATLNFAESSGKVDYVVIGEAPDAHDGPPQDTYDMPKAPTPPAPYLRVWLNDNLPNPYSTLLKDYRHGPSISKQWNLTTLWFPNNPTDPPANVTITWEPSTLAQSTYTTIYLTTIENTIVADMVKTTSYTFECPNYTPQTFHIQCSTKNHAPIAHDDYLTTTINIAQTIDVLANDTDPDNGDIIHIHSYTQPPHGTTTQQNHNLYYTPDQGYCGLDSFTYTIQDSYDATDSAIVHIIVGCGNTPPDTPTTPQGPVTGYHNIDYSYMTYSFDADNDMISYRFDWGDSIISSWTDTYESGETCTLGHIWTAPGQYTIQVQARDTHNAFSTWSPQLVIQLENHPPNSPSSPTPTNHAIDVSLSSSLKWQANDPDTDTLTYDIYFGITATPPKVVTQQAGRSFTPNLQEQTHYYWQIVAWDPYEESTKSPLWEFTTGTTGTSSGGSSGGGLPTNQPPTALASVTYTEALVKTSIQFNGTRSYDTDGFIISWTWDYGDGHTKTGEVTTYSYTQPGTYTVTLTVVDDMESTATDSFQIKIITANHPPDTPNIQGPTKGDINTEYEFIITLVDKDNDALQTKINWGDETQYHSEYHPNGTMLSVNHSWDHAGRYLITVQINDNATWSEKIRYVIFIDATLFQDYGLLLDTDSNGIYDTFYDNESGIETIVTPQDDGLYLVDINNDGLWDYRYDPSTGIIEAYQTLTKNDDTFSWVLVGIIISSFTVILGIFILRHYQK
ncbi:MAG: PKD domain-containing protein [Candidatus Thermoplasmatota archaeon]|nr:PKD domain-containing protein [Candidatus Thermoplasmatota archaeon]